MKRDSSLLPSRWASSALAAPRTWSIRRSWPAPCWPRTAAGPATGRGRRRHRQHLRLHRGGARGVDRGHPLRLPAEGGRDRARRHRGRCLPQRYQKELAESLPEVDAFIGLDELDECRRDRPEARRRKGRVYAGIANMPSRLFDPGSTPGRLFGRAVRLPQDRRRLQPCLRFLRHSRDPGRPSFAPDAGFRQGSETPCWMPDTGS